MFGRGWLPNLVPAKELILEDLVTIRADRDKYYYGFPAQIAAPLSSHKKTTTTIELKWSHQQLTICGASLRICPKLFKKPVTRNSRSLLESRQQFFGKFCYIEIPLRYIRRPSPCLSPPDRRTVRRSMKLSSTVVVSCSSDATAQVRDRSANVRAALPLSPKAERINAIRNSEARVSSMIDYPMRGPYQVDFPLSFMPVNVFPSSTLLAHLMKPFSLIMEHYAIMLMRCGSTCCAESHLRDLSPG